MFYFTPEGWKPYTKSIQYTELVQVYDNSDENYQVKHNLTSEDVTLTEEQLRRLETIKFVSSMGVEDVRKYVFDNVVEDVNLADAQSEIKAEETRQKLIKLIRWDELTSEEMLDLVDDFKEYSVGSFYVVGDIFSLDNQLYQVLQAHTSQEGWPPDQTPALYKPIAPPSVIPEWVQPTGAHDAYSIGDRIIFEGVVYESLIDGNTWSPKAYPRGWKTV